MMDLPGLLFCIAVLIQILLASWLIQPFVLFLIYLAGKRPAARQSKPKITGDPEERSYRFGLIITMHRETGLIHPIVDSIIKQTYPHFNAYIVADACDTSGLRFSDPRINILVPSNPLNNKSKSITYALDQFEEKDEIMVIFDPDNLLHPEFLQIMNGWFNKGYSVVQGNLRSKNTREAFARVETLGVVFSNFVDRDTQSMFGLSSHIWGCGISMKKNIYYGIAFAPKCQKGGFDKQMQIEIVKKIGSIGYAEEAIFYDEKVDNGRSFEKQRIRWIGSYFAFLGDSFGLLYNGILKRNFNMAWFGYNLIRPPYFLLALAASFFIALDWTLNPLLSIIWIFLLGLFALSFIAIVILRSTDKTIARAVWLLPVLFYHQILALFQLGAGRRSFLKTDHSKIIYIDELLNQEDQLKRKDLVNREDLLNQEDPMNREDLLNQEDPMNREDLLNQEDPMNREDLLNQDKLLKPEPLDYDHAP